MTVYVDTSVVMRTLLGEPNPVGIWSQWNKAYSSALWRFEALRTVDRLRLTHEISDFEVAEIVREIKITHETFAIHPVTHQILSASERNVSHRGWNPGCASFSNRPLNTRN